MNWRDKFDAAKVHFLTIRSSTVQLPLQARSLVSATGAIFALVTVLALSNVLGWWLGSLSDISAMKPRISRLLGYIEAAPQFESATAEVESALAQVAIEDTGDTGRGGALLQQQLRQLASAVGLTVVGSEVKEPTQLEALVKLNASLQVIGGPDDLDGFFQALSRISGLVPRGTCGSINRRIRNPNAATADHLSARVDVAAYRLSELVTEGALTSWRDWPKSLRLSAGLIVGARVDSDVHFVSRLTK